MVRVNIGLNRTLVGLVIIGLVVWLLSCLQTIVFELLVALGIAYILDPVADRLERLVKSRGLAILLMLVPLITVVTLVSIFLIPRLAEEIGLFAVSLPAKVGKLYTWALGMLDQQFHVKPPRDLEEVMSRFGGDIKSALPGVLAALKATVGGLFTGGVGIFHIISVIFLVPIFSVYLLLDFDRIVVVLRGLIPRRYEPVVVAHVREIDEAVAGFFRGQLTVCLILGTLYSVGYSIVGVDLALVIGLGTGILVIVPYVGALIGFTTALTFTIVAYASGSGSGWQILGVVIVFASVQALDATFITPKVLGRSVNLSPIFILIALMVGGSLLGFLGVLIAVPAAASVRVITRSLVAWYKTTEFFQHGLVEQRTPLPSSATAARQWTEAVVEGHALPEPKVPDLAGEAAGNPPTEVDAASR